MFRQLLAGAVVSAYNITIHALIMAALVQIARRASTMYASQPSLRLIAVMIATVSILMASHACEVMVWSLVYASIDAAPSGTDLMYFAFVNYTTLGYGDVVPAEHWRLIGSLTAMNGVCCLAGRRPSFSRSCVERCIVILSRWRPNDCRRLEIQIGLSCNQSVTATLDVCAQPRSLRLCRSSRK